MKQKVKRKKALLGSLISGGLGALGAVASALISSGAQKKLADQQQRLQTLGSNQENSFNFTGNLNNAINANLQEELDEEKLNTINTVNNSFGFKCGGKKRMKVGGNVSANVKGLGRYI